MLHHFNMIFHSSNNFCDLHAPKKYFLSYTTLYIVFRLQSLGYFTDSISLTETLTEVGVTEKHRIIAQLWHFLVPLRHPMSFSHTADIPFELSVGLIEEMHIMQDNSV